MFLLFRLNVILFIFWADYMSLGEWWHIFSFEVIFFVFVLLKYIFFICINRTLQFDGLSIVSAQELFQSLPFPFFVWKEWAEGFSSSAFVGWQALFHLI